MYVCTHMKILYFIVSMYVMSECAVTVLSFAVHSVRGPEVGCRGVCRGRALHRGLRLARSGQGAELELAVPPIAHLTPI